MYPNFLQPTNLEIFKVNNKIVEIPKCIVRFNRWTGIPLTETFGGKPLISFADKPMFAELAIMNYFIADGWESRWIETYGKSNKQPIYLTNWKDEKYKNQINHPIEDKEITRMLQSISGLNSDSFSGCWDVLAWKNENIVFAESKRTKKDSIRSTQTAWLTACLKFGLKPTNFLIVQWDM